MTDHKRDLGADTVERIYEHRLLDQRGCVLIEHFNTLAMIGEWISEWRERYRPYDGAA